MVLDWTEGEGGRGKGRWKIRGEKGTRGEVESKSERKEREEKCVMATRKPINNNQIETEKKVKKNHSPKTHRNRQIIATGQLRNLAHIPKARAHDHRLVPILLVVIENALHALDARVLVGGELALLLRLVPVHDAPDKGRDEKGTRLGGGDGLHEREHERQVAVDAVLGLQDVRGLDAFPGRGDLDEDAFFADADGFVELWEGKEIRRGED